MPVTLSPLAGAGQQFFDNNGNPLTGGKLYTYFAGTTTPLAAYTTNSGAIAHTNPIILDSAGRVPSGGEIWLTLGVGYKFVLTTSADVVIATYDNIPSSAQPPAANDADSILYEQGYTVTAGNFVVGRIYRILTVGDTNFTLIGAASNTVGIHFVATGSGIGTGTAEYSRSAEAKLREWASVTDFGATGTGISDDTVALQAALNVGVAVYIPAGTYLFSSLTVYGNTRLYGASTRNSILKHTGSGVAITCSFNATNDPDGRGLYIEDGWFIFQDFELMVNGTVGFDVGNTRSSFTNWERIYIRHRQDISSGVAYFPGSTAIRCDNTPWDSGDATYIEKLHNVFIRGFENGIALKAIVNAWELNRVYTIQVKNQIVLDQATGINLVACYFESSIPNSRGIVFQSGGGNQVTVNTCSFELTATTGISYAYDFSAGGPWERVTVLNTKYLIDGDGGSVNTRRIVGTSPVTFAEFNRTYLSSVYGVVPMIWAPGATANNPYQLPSFSRIGGFGLGDGRITLGRNTSDSADARIENDGTYGMNFVGPSTLLDFAWKNSAGSDFLTYTSYGTSAFAPGRDNVDQLGTSSFRWSVVNTVRAKMTPVAVASLPAAGTAGSGAKAFVSDSTATTFGTIVAGGGVNPVPVYSDGTNWRIG